MDNINEIYDFIYKDCDLNDCSMRKLNETDGDIGYFEDYPCNIIEIRNNKITYFVASKGMNITGGDNSIIFKPIFDLMESGTFINI